MACASALTASPLTSLVALWGMTSQRALQLAAQQGKEEQFEQKNKC
jgi:hypothetical protein